MSPAKVATTALLAALLAAFTPAFAQVTFNITVGPPPPQYEVVPVMPVGYVWAPGYWAWHGDRHIWIGGRSMVQRVGYRWEPDVWEQRDNRYYRHPGFWQSNSSYQVVEGKKPKPSKNWKKEGKDHGNKGRPGKSKQNDD